MSLLRQAPRFDVARAARIARDHFGLTADAAPLPSERDQNFLLETPSRDRYTLKIANAAESPAFLEAQNAALARLGDCVDFCPRLVPANDGETLVDVDGHLVRIMTWLPGRTLGEVRWHSPALLAHLGSRLAALDRALEDFDHPAVHRDFYWDLARAARTIHERLPLVRDASTREIVEIVLGRVDRRTALLERLPRSVIHNDANDHNVLVSAEQVTGLIDFGDMVHTFTVAEPAVAMAYTCLDDSEPLRAIAAVARGYHSGRPFSSDELLVLFDLVCLRLCLSVCIAADQQLQRPGDEYLAISQEPIRRTLPRLVEIPPAFAEACLQTMCEPRRMQRSESGGIVPGRQRTRADTLAARRQLIGPNLSLSYREPVTIVRGWMQYLFDETGRRYIDAYNNVPHVGHAHPHVCDAVDRQMRLLNTNTRYLHDNLVTLAERLVATVPEPLRVCYFVNSGSEANELALRLARAHTRSRDVIVLEAAYHGHTTGLIEISPYKFNGPGGEGQREWVHVAPLPDGYRGRYKNSDPDAGRHYAEAVGEIAERLRSKGGGPAAFIAETCPSVGGQILPPPGYLASAYQHVRRAGGVCIADEVQTAYGRTGSSFYAFEGQAVVPDVLVLGKPIGNGFPLGAVITTREIASSFDNGMEFFSTFGGSTVSCAAGLATLEVVRDEDLQRHAAHVGEHLLARLRPLAASHGIIGDVRGSGLFLGVELVKDRSTLAPATAEAGWVVNKMRDEGILLGTDGPFHNVLKIRPPMPFGTDDADALAGTLDRVLARLERNEP